MTNRAPALCAVIDELIPAAFHKTEQYANNRSGFAHGTVTVNATEPIEATVGLTALPMRVPARAPARAPKFTTSV